MGKVRFRPLKTRRLSEIIEGSIKDLILVGELEAGSKLPTEKEIGKQFGVSLVTVREALRGLEAFGIIQKKRGKDGGIFVAHTERHVVKTAMQSFLSSEKLSASNLNEVRRIVEPSCVRIAASRITPDELKEIEKNIRYCENKIETRKHDFTEKDFFAIEERNVEFHRMLAAATHNPILLVTVDYVEDFLLSFKKLNLAPDVEFSIRATSGHRRIHSALVKGDAKTAEQEMIRHIESVGEYLEAHEH